jgi:hypothetical protein
MLTTYHSLASGLDFAVPTDWPMCFLPRGLARWQFGLLGDVPSPATMELWLAILGNAPRSSRLTRSKRSPHNTDLNLKLGQLNG